MGVIARGKIESGCCRVGDKCIIMPNRSRAEVINIYYEETETDSCVCGESIRRKLKNVEEVRTIFDDLFLINKYKFIGNRPRIYLM
jgi:translation elongation factor EF-1alpha